MDRLTRPIRGQLETIASHRLDGVAAATFDTRGRGPRFLTGAASRGVAKLLRQTGATWLVEPESFLIEGTAGPLAEGQLERARAWARDLLVRLNASQVHATADAVYRTRRGTMAIRVTVSGTLTRWAEKDAVLALLRRVPGIQFEETMDVSS